MQVAYSAVIRANLDEQHGLHFETAQRASSAQPLAGTAFDSAFDRFVVRADQVVIEGQARESTRFILSLGDTTNRWECRFTNDTLFTAILKPAGRKGFSWAVSDRAGRAQFATTVTRFDEEDLNQGHPVFRQGTLAPEPDGSVVIAWLKLGSGGLVPMTVRLESASQPAGFWKVGFRAKGQWQDVGGKTPEAALQTLLWAAREKALARIDEVVFLPRRPDDGWYGSYTNDVPHVLGRVKQCSGVTIEDVKYEGAGVAVIRMAVDGIPAGQVAVSKQIRMIQVGTGWKCDYPHDSLVAFKVREK